MPDLFLFPGAATAANVILRDPTQANIALLARSEVRVGTSSRLTAPAALTATSGIRVGSQTGLNVVSPLLAQSTISVGSQARLTVIPSLTAQSGFRVSTAVGPLIMAADLKASSGVRFATVGPSVLSVGGFPLSAASSVAVSSRGRLTGLAAALSAVSAFRVSSVGNINAVGPSATTMVMTINGAVATGVRRGSITIVDNLNEAANTCEFLIDGTPPPALGADVKIGLYSVAPGNLLFAGTVRQVDKLYELQRTHVVWRVSCDDYTFLINRRLVFGSWRNVSASTVAAAIVTTFAPGFSTAGIVGGLPAITLTIANATVMAALQQVAKAAGAYVDVDYNKVVQLFVTRTGAAPQALTLTEPTLMLGPPVTHQLDEAPLRTRVIVTGASASVGGPAGFNIPAGSTELPVENATIFSSGQVLTDDAQIVNYSGVAPGGLAATVRGNVAAPIGTPTTVVAPGVSGGLDGTYRWAVAFANAGGETEVGPQSIPLLVPPPVTAPTFGPGVGLPFTNAIGPIIGAVQYAVTFVTQQGETLRSPLVSRTASAVAAPPPLTVGDAPAAGTLQVGATYHYVTTYVTTYGETLPSPPVTYVPGALGTAALVSSGLLPFGGLEASGTYTYGSTIVTAVGESAPPALITVASGSTNAPGGLSYGGLVDANGRLAPGTYEWAATFYSDLYGETGLGPHFTFTNTGTVPVRFWLNLPSSGLLPAGADGLRVYRGIVTPGISNPLQLNADFRRGSVPAAYWDGLSQGECGNPWPIHQRRNPGPRVDLTLFNSSAPGVLARRVYRSKANGTELFLVFEVQNNVAVGFAEGAFDANLVQRNPVVQTTGRSAFLTLPLPPARPGFLGRRVYRTQANGSVYYRVAEVADVTTTTIVDNKPDATLTEASLPTVSTAGGDQHQISSILVGPSGTLARRVYRTPAGSSELKLVGQISNNTDTTFLDAVADAQLGAAAPLTNTAGGAAAQLTNVPIGSAGVTQRIIYRNKNGSTQLLYAGTIDDNTTTTFVDKQADTALGRTPQAESTIGATAGDASIVLKSTAGWPAPGWVDADSQVIRYTGISGNSLTGIPPLLSATITRSGILATLTTASAHGYTTGQRIVVLGADQKEYNGAQTITVTGSTTATYEVAGAPATPATGTIKASAPGAITGAIAGGLTVKSVPMLTGVSGLAVAIKQGSSVRLYVVRNSAAGQAAIAATEGGDGVHEAPVEDGSLDSVAACAARGDAELALFEYARVALTYDTRDVGSKSGMRVHVDLPAPQSLLGDFLIQRVTITALDEAPRTPPKFSVLASNTKYSLEDLLRHVVTDDA